jgi:hypothetical protein
LKSWCLALLGVSLLLGATTAASGASVGDFVPRGAANCAIGAPPMDAGLAGTPGGFVIVRPRNAALPARYTGCKVMWVDANPGDWQRFAALYFENGELRRLVAHDARRGGDEVRAACAYPRGNSLLPGTDATVTNPACAGVREEPFYGLHLPTWPRRCATDPDHAACRSDPK